MTQKILHIILSAAALLSPAAVFADSPKNVLDIKSEITDSNIIFPESYELDTRNMLESWYLKNYTATDNRYKTQGDVKASDATIRDRLSKLNTVIEMPFNQIVRSYIDRYTDKSRAQVAALLGLSLYYMPIFEQALEEQGLPLELKYLPVIESGLNPNAVSKHGAAGLWQFMLATGKGLDMEISSLVDERRDPYVSSKRAAKYLKDLYASYNDWSLAIAAYNCGPGTVNKAIRRAGGQPADHDFWSIYYFLPAETRGYVPMFIAANYVMNYYPYHNISPVLATKPLVTDTLMISDRVHFNQISNVLDIPVDEIRVLNPQFRADLIPGRPEHPYTLILPSQQVHAYIMSEGDILAFEAEKYAQRTEVEPGLQPGELLAEETGTPVEETADDTPLEQAPESQPEPVRKVSTAASGAATKTVTHKVEPGETLSGIATKYQVSVDDLKTWNNLTRNSVRTGQKLRVTTSAAIAAATGAPETAPASQTPRKNDNWKKDTDSKKANAAKAETSSKKNQAKDKKAEPKAPAVHTVKSGETLTAIAKKYGTTVDALKKANNMSNDNLHPGDAIKLPSGKGAAATKSTTSSKAKVSGSKTKTGKSSGSKSKRKR